MSAAVAGAFATRRGSRLSRRLRHGLARALGRRRLLLGPALLGRSGVRRLFRAIALVFQLGLHEAQFLALAIVDCRILQVQVLERVDDRASHDQPREPLVIGGHDVPRRVVAGGVLDHVFVGVLVVVPEVALLGVGHRELPVLVLLLQALQEALLLLALGHVEEELEDHDAVARQVPLDALDVLEAFLPDVVGHQLRRQFLPVQQLGVHADDEHLLVVRAIEDADASALGQALERSPQEVVIELFGRRRLEGKHLAPAGVHARHHVLDRCRPCPPRPSPGRRAAPTTDPGHRACPEARTAARRLWPATWSPPPWT